MCHAKKFWCQHMQGLKRRSSETFFLAWKDWNKRKSHIDVQFVTSSKGPLDTNNIPFFDFLVFRTKNWFRSPNSCNCNDIF